MNTTTKPAAGTMLAKIYRLESCGRELWRLMATRDGLNCGLGHMIDFDTEADATMAAAGHARRNHWEIVTTVKIVD